jgi:hypothetical protein
MSWRCSGHSGVASRLFTGQSGNGLFARNHGQDGAEQKKSGVGERAGRLFFSVCVPMRKIDETRQNENHDNRWSDSSHINAPD